MRSRIKCCCRKFSHHRHNTTTAAANNNNKSNIYHLSQSIARRQIILTKTQGARLLGVEEDEDEIPIDFRVMMMMMILIGACERLSQLGPSWAAAAGGAIGDSATVNGGGGAELCAQEKLAGTREIVEPGTRLLIMINSITIVVHVNAINHGHTTRNHASQEHHHIHYYYNYHHYRSSRGRQCLTNVLVLESPHRSLRSPLARELVLIIIIIIIIILLLITTTAATIASTSTIITAITILVMISAHFHVAHNIWSRVIVGESDTTRNCVHEVDKIIRVASRKPYRAQRSLGSLDESTSASPPEASPRACLQHSNWLPYDLPFYPSSASVAGQARSTSTWMISVCQHLLPAAMCCTSIRTFNRAGRAGESSSRGHLFPHWANSKDYRQDYCDLELREATILRWQRINGERPFCCCCCLDERAIGSHLSIVHKNQSAIANELELVVEGPPPPLPSRSHQLSLHSVQLIGCEHQANSDYYHPLLIRSNVYNESRKRRLACTMTSEDEDEDNHAKDEVEVEVEDKRLKTCTRLEPREQSSQLISSRNRAALKLTTGIVVLLWALFHLDSVGCFTNYHYNNQYQHQNKPDHGLDETGLTGIGRRHQNHDQTMAATTGQLVLGLGLMESSANATDTADRSRQPNGGSLMSSDVRWSFGQRLLALGNGATSLALNSSLLARTLRHLNGKLKPLASGASGDSFKPDAVGTQAADQMMTNKSIKKDYETTQISESGQDTVWLKGGTTGAAGSSAVVASVNGKVGSGLARPNLSLDTWARLINLRNINATGATGVATSSLPVSTSGIEISTGGEQLSLQGQPNQTTTAASERPKTSFNFAQGTARYAPGVPAQLTSTPAQQNNDQDRRSPLLPVATGSGPISSSSSPPSLLGDSAQETLSIGIMIKPSPTSNNKTSQQPEQQQQQQLLNVSEKDTVAATAAAGAASTSTKHDGGGSFGSPDWQASTDIEQVIYTGARSSSSDTDTKQEVSGKQEATKQAHKEEANNGEQLKGHDESGHWSKEKHGAEGEQGQAKKGASDGDQRLVDMGHNKHGWKNVYHKEEYAQHHKYHDVFRDKDWHDKKGKYNESHQYNRGNKFNESLSKSYLDKDKTGSKYDYRKGNDWKRSEEERAVDHDTGQLSSSSAADEADNDSDQLQPIRALDHQYHHGGDEDHDHQKVGSNNRKSVTASVGGDSGHHNRDQDSGDNMDDDLVLEQMKARLENMSEQYGDGGSNQPKSRQAASEGVYQLQRPPPSGGTSGQYHNNNTHESIDRNQNISEGAAVDEPTSKRANSDERDQPNHRLKDGIGGGKQLKQQASNFAPWNRDDNRTRYDMSTGSGANTEANTDDEDSDDDDADSGDGAYGRPKNPASRDQIAQDKPNKTIVRGEDKRNGLRLKLELDLGKSSAVNQIPAASEDQASGQQQRLRNQNGNFSLTKTFALGPSGGGRSFGAGSRANSTPIVQQQQQPKYSLTNSLGHSIGSNTHKSGPPIGGWQANSNTTKTRAPLELANPVVKQTRDSTNSWTRDSSKDDARHNARDSNTSANPTTKSPPPANNWPKRQRQDGVVGVGNSSARLTAPPAQMRPPSMPLQNRKTPARQNLQRPHSQSPIYVRHLEMNGGGIVLGKLDDFQPSLNSNNNNRSNAAQLAAAFGHYDDSQSPGLSFMGADDLTVETSLPASSASASEHHLFQPYHDYDHELTLAGAQKPTISVLEHEEPRGPREFMVVFGGGGGDGGGSGGSTNSDDSEDSHDDVDKLHRHVVMTQASDHSYSRHHQGGHLRQHRPATMMQEQLTSDYELNGGPHAKGEPSVIFEADASTIQDDLRPPSSTIDHYNTAISQLANHHHHGLPMVSAQAFDSLRHEESHHHQLNRPHYRQHHRHNQHQQQQQEAMLNDYLNYDYSTAHLSYANAPQSPAAQQVDHYESSGETNHQLYMLNTGGHNKLVSGTALPSAPANQLVEPQTVSGGNQFWDHALNRLVPSGQSTKWSATNLKPDAHFTTASSTSKPMIATLRDHMNSLPLSLLRAASSVNYALLSPQQPATTMQAPLMLQHQSPSSSIGGGTLQQQSGSVTNVGTNSLVVPLVSSAASVIPFGRWLRLPRVIENQFQQQRSKRYNKQLLASEQQQQQQQASAPGTMAWPIQQQQQLSIGQQWPAKRPNVNNNRPYYQSPTDYELQPALMTSSLQVDPMQAEYSAHKVSHALAAANVTNDTLPRSRPANLTSNTNNHRNQVNNQKSMKTFATDSSHYQELTGGGSSAPSRNPFRQASLAAVRHSSGLTKHHHQVGKLSGTKRGNNNSNGNNGKLKQTNLMKTDYSSGSSKKRDHPSINYDKMPMMIVPAAAAANDRLKSGDNKREHHVVQKITRTKTKTNNYHNNINSYHSNSNRPNEFGYNRSQLQAVGDGDGALVMAAAASTLKPQRVAPINMVIHRQHHQIDHRQHQSASPSHHRANHYQLTRPLILSGHQNKSPNHSRNHRYHDERPFGQSQLPLFPMAGSINRQNSNNKKRFLVADLKQQQIVGRLRGGGPAPLRLISNNNNGNSNNKPIESQAKIGSGSKHIVKSSISSFGQRVLDNLKFSTKSI